MNIKETGYFSKPKDMLMPQLFEKLEGGLYAMRTEVRQIVIDTFHNVMEENGLVGSRDWAHFYLMGSSVSFQWDGNLISDTDIQCVVDWGEFRDRNSLGDLDEGGLRKKLVLIAIHQMDNTEVNEQVFLQYYIRPETVKEYLNIFQRTNQGIYIIYGEDLEGVLHEDYWFIKPLALPKDYDPMKFYPELFLEAEQISGQIEGIHDKYRMSYGEERQQYRSRLKEWYKALRDMRAKAYREGEGYVDRGNFIWQYMEQYSILKKLKSL